MDRFLFKVVVGYPDREIERMIYERTTSEDLQRPAVVMNGAEILAAQALARSVPVSQLVLDYVLDLVRATRAEAQESPAFVRDAILVGAGPRGGQALVKAAKVRAALAGRPQARIDDVRAVAKPVLRHRILLSYAAEAAGETADGLIERLIAAVPVGGEGGIDGRIAAALGS